MPKTVFALMLALVTAPVRSHGLAESLQFHGFVSQGFIATSDNRFFGSSATGGSFDFLESGLNASWQASPALLLAAQLQYRRAGATDKAGLRLDYGFIDWTVKADNENRWGLRLGRITNPLGFYNDTRDVSFTRPSILLPQSPYFDTARIFALAGDGLGVYGERRSGRGDLFLQANVVRLQSDDPGLEASVFLGRAEGEFESDPSFVGRLAYEWDGGRVRLALSRVVADLDYEPTAPPGLRAGSFRFTPWMVSAQYNDENWSLTGEYLLRTDRFEGFGPLLPDQQVTGSSWYVQGSYRFRPDLEALLRYDVLYLNDDDRHGRRFERETGLPRHLQFAEDWTLGITWQASSQVQLRAEYHRVDGTGWLSPLENPDLTALSRRWDLFALMASFRF